MSGMQEFETSTNVKNIIGFLLRDLEKQTSFGSNPLWASTMVK